MGYQHKHYARTGIQTSDPRAVVVLLYEGAIKFLNRAAEAARRDERMAVSEAILKAQKIIYFLTSSLDFEEGGEVANNLERLYAYMRDTLNEANLHCSLEQIKEIVSLLQPLLEAWRDVAQDPKAAVVLEARRARLGSHTPTARSENPLTTIPTVTSPHTARNAAAAAYSSGVSPLGPTPVSAAPKPPAANEEEQKPQKPDSETPSAVAGRAAYGVR